MTHAWHDVTPGLKLPLEFVADEIEVGLVRVRQYLAVGADDARQELAVVAAAGKEIQHLVTRAYAERFSWPACAEEFRRNLEPLPKPEKKAFWKRLAEARARARERRRLNRERREKRRAEIAKQQQRR